MAFLLFIYTMESIVPFRNSIVGNNYHDTTTQQHTICQSLVSQT